MSQRPRATPANPAEDTRRCSLPVLTGVAVGAEVAVAAAALAGPDAHFVLLAGEVALAHGWTDGQTESRHERECHRACPCSPKPPSPAEQGTGSAVACRVLLSCGTVTVLASSRAGWRGPSPAKCHQPPAALLSSSPATSLRPPSPALSLPPAARGSSVPRPAPHRRQRQLRALGENGDAGRANAGSPQHCPPPALLRDRSSVTATPPPPLPHGPPPAPLLPRGPCAGADAWSGAGAGRGTRDRQHHGADRRRQIPHGPGQASLATRRGRADHPPHPPYLGVLRPTVMDTIETPKIDRLHRLGAVSLAVRAGWGGEEMGQLAGGTVLPPLSWQTLSFSLPAGTPQGPLPAAGTQAPSACSERLRGRMHRGLVGYVVFDAPGRCAELLGLSWGKASPAASRDCGEQHRNPGTGTGIVAAARGMRAPG